MLDVVSRAWQRNQSTRAGQGGRRTARLLPGAAPAQLVCRGSGVRRYGLGPRIALSSRNSEGVKGAFVLRGFGWLPPRGSARRGRWVARAIPVSANRVPRIQTGTLTPAASRGSDLCVLSSLKTRSRDSRDGAKARASQLGPFSFWLRKPAVARPRVWRALRYTHHLSPITLERTK